jgi:hypothetical protein
MEMGASRGGCAIAIPAAIATTAAIHRIIWRPLSYRTTSARDGSAANSVFPPWFLVSISRPSAHREFVAQLNEKTPPPPIGKSFSHEKELTGNTALVGGSFDNSAAGAAWAYTRSGGVWVQQTDRLSGAEGGFLGASVGLSADGSTAIVGAPLDVSAVDGGTSGSANVRVGFLLGDVNQNRVVTVSYLVLVNTQIAHAVTAANFLLDVNATGTLTVGDKVIVNANVAKGLADPVTRLGFTRKFGRVQPLIEVRTIVALVVLPVCRPACDRGSSAFRPACTTGL